jgi:hypothetical protein
MSLNGIFYDDELSQENIDMMFEMDEREAMFKHKYGRHWPDIVHAKYESGMSVDEILAADTENEDRWVRSMFSRFTLTQGLCSDTESEDSDHRGGWNAGVSDDEEQENEVDEEDEDPENGVDENDEAQSIEDGNGTYPQAEDASASKPSQGFPLCERTSSPSVSAKEEQVLVPSIIPNASQEHDVVKDTPSERWVSFLGFHSLSLTAICTVPLRKILWHLQRSALAKNLLLCLRRTRNAKSEVRPNLNRPGTFILIGRSRLMPKQLNLRCSRLYFYQRIGLQHELLCWHCFQCSCHMNDYPEYHPGSCFTVDQILAG